MRRPLSNVRLLALGAFIAMSGPAFADNQPTSGSKELHGVMMKSAKESQSMKSSGNVDHDFLTMMRHHHQSGIRMAEVELRHGKSEEARAMAQKIIEAQKKEVAEIDKMLEKHGAASGSSASK